jgi:hypothetical protein
LAIGRAEAERRAATMFAVNSEASRCGASSPPIQVNFRTVVHLDFKAAEVLGSIANRKSKIANR